MCNPAGKETMFRNELENHLNQLLDVSRFQDYCPNGLQVEGREHIQKIVTGVTASLELLQAAIAHEADAVIVHHGYFWRGESACITGMKHRRIALLMQHGINLFAYHLPLDMHSELGNNVQLAKRLGFVENGRFGEQDIVVRGALQEAMPLCALGHKIAQALGREPQIIGNPEQSIRQLAWCTGAAQGYFEAAIAQSVDAYITEKYLNRQCMPRANPVWLSLRRAITQRNAMVCRHWVNTWRTNSAFSINSLTSIIRYSLGI